MKLHSHTPGRRGAINLQWDASGLLRCRIVNRGSGKPSSITGDFVEYVLARHRKRVKQRSEAVSRGPDGSFVGWTLQLVDEDIRDFSMAGDRFDGTGGGIAPERMRGAFTFQAAAVAAQVLQQAAALHFTITVPRSASGGTPRKPSSRRSARISARA